MSGWPAPTVAAVVRHRLSPWLAYLSAAGAVEGSALFESGVQVKVLRSYA